MNKKADDVTVPGEPQPAANGLERTLILVASALTVGSIAANLILQIVHFLKKRPVEPDQRDKLQAAGLALTVLKTMPGLIKQARLLVSQLRQAA